MDGMEGRFLHTYVNIFEAACLKLGMKYPVRSVELIVQHNEFVTFSLIRSWKRRYAD